jgi:hypothetical protein
MMGKAPKYGIEKQGGGEFCKNANANANVGA